MINGQARSVRVTRHRATSNSMRQCAPQFLAGVTETVTQVVTVLWGGFKVPAESQCS
jgi:hypothetical protein